MTILGLILVGGAMFGLGFLTSLWITFGAVRGKYAVDWAHAGSAPTEPTYWTTTVGTTATSWTVDAEEVSVRGE